ncbi:riboflavin synthase [Thermodesulfatator autotrophicus]|uniref:Riboflavin synthase n=1 Tax=Thermodesulfatator autotrophicus TaxID=1795632 RepID=A0A177E824_9BACT|nr:riboflavin synthase [Thermodesulfatator autotrophicus]OAG27846.1 riboflavin synthase subunit alpha [Thermodesulfatator autotrophicus]
MFTGIVEGLGKIVKIVPLAKGRRFFILVPFDISDTKLGDSIAVNGACLTVTTLEGDVFSVDVSPETLKRTTLGSFLVGEKVNLERALRVGDRLGGHLVTGHVDGVGQVIDRREQGDFIFYKIEVPRELSRYLVEKGSIAVDGISLTVNQVKDNVVELAIIPHTAKLTTIGFRKPGDTVNIEVDIIGKYVERLLKPYSQGTVTQEFLKLHGFDLDG